LWAIAVSELSETNARPLFSPSRRPPAPPVLAALTSSPAKPAPPRKPEPHHPLLTLLGTIVGDSVEIGVFTDEATHDVILLKAGEAHDGWTLSSVVGRATFFQKDGFPAATLALPAPGAQGTAPNGGAASPITQPVAIQSSSQMTGVPPADNFVPANTEGGSRRPPKEG
jgi:general secretion pathway protein N